MKAIIDRLWGFANSSLADPISFVWFFLQVVASGALPRLQGSFLQCALLGIEIQSRDEIVPPQPKV